MDEPMITNDPNMEGDKDQLPVDTQTTNDAFTQNDDLKPDDDAHDPADPADMPDRPSEDTPGNDSTF